MSNLISRYALASCVLTYMACIGLAHMAGLFPQPGLYDLSRLVGCSQVVVMGRVLDSPIIRWNQTRFLLAGRASPLDAFHGKVLVTLGFPDPTLAPGDFIRLRGWLSAPRPLSGTRTFDEKSYWATQRVFSKLKVWSPEAMRVLKRSHDLSLGRAAWTFHQHYREFWERRLPPDEAALLLGMTVGARGVLPKHIKDACIRAGVYHIVVVSGQNMSLIVGLGVGLLLLFHIPRRHAFWICLAPVIFYTATVGGDPPVMRAAAMSIVGLLIAALGRDVPRFYPLLIAAGWILVQEPEALLGASFQLSFGATLSILMILPFWREREDSRRRFFHWLISAGLMGLAVHVGIWPILIHYFHRVSLAGFLANWTVFPLSGVVMMLGLSIGTWGMAFPHGVPDMLIQTVYGAVRLTLSLIEKMAAWPHAVYAVTPPPAWVVGLYYGILFGILFLISRRKNPFKPNYEKAHPTSRPGIQRG